MCGGVSAKLFIELYKLRSSPHAWGCFLAYWSEAFPQTVFPTCVGVFPFKRRGRDFR